MTSKVLKFGGTSVKDAEAILASAAIVATALKSSSIPAVVVSALGGVTNELIALAGLAQDGDESYESRLSSLSERHKVTANELCSNSTLQKTQDFLDARFLELSEVLRGVFLLRELTPRSLDFILSFGERLSASIVNAAFESQGIKSDYLDARTLIRTDDNFTDARVDLSLTDKNLQDFFSKDRPLQVTTGFIAATDENETTTLGRGGSDFTASILASALNVDTLELWTDVNGVMSADPRKVKSAFTQPAITYEEAMELSHFGAKVIHPPTLAPVRQKGIPLYIRNTFDPTHAGTRVSNEHGSSECAVTGISSVSNVSLLQVQGPGVWHPRIRTRVFSVLAESGIPLKLITQGSFDQSLCFAVSDEDAELAREQLEQEFSLELEAKQIEKFLVEGELTAISVVGENMRHQSGVSGKLFRSLGVSGISVVAIAQGSSERNISCIVQRKDEIKALNTIHHEFFGEKDRLNIALLGAGNVGRELIAQLTAQSSDLSTDAHLDIRLIGVASSKKSFYDTDGIPFEAWQEILSKQDDVENSATTLRDSILADRMSHTVFVDCTGASGFLDVYTDLLEAGIPVVTPNKRVQTGSMSDYQILRKAASRRNVLFLSEASVGAGLPVLSTLTDLLRSGDKVLSIEAVLSGTLSYIFNSLSSGGSFSDIVKQAHELGYTEPDPREDLNGQDVARKVVILARKIGLSLELPDLDLEPLLPQELLSETSIDTFMQKLPELDAGFSERIKNANAEDSKLLYLVKIEDGKASVKLSNVHRSHPFHSLSGSDNVISFRTSRYNENPLVIRGPGAGVEVTAAAVLADILKTQKLLN